MCLFLLCVPACADTEGEATVGGDDAPAMTHQDEYAPQYFLNAEDAVAKLGPEGVGSLNFGGTFSTVEIVLEGEPRALDHVELRLLDAEGQVKVDWHVPTFDERDERRAAGVIDYGREAAVLEVRAPSGKTIEFARFAVSLGVVDHGEQAPLSDTDELAQALAHPGRWIPSADIMRQANSQNLRYTGSPSRCAKGAAPGTRELADHLVRSFRGARSWAGFACRANTANRNRLSVHASGRAIDLFVPLDRGRADNDLGDPVANYLIAHAEALGIEFVIWDRSQWSASKSSKLRSYGGPHPHHDHLHIELSPQSANRTGKRYPSPGAGSEPVTPPPRPRTKYLSLQGDFNGDGRADWTALSPNGLGSWRDTAFTEYGTATGLISTAPKAGTPIHMRNGDASKDFRVLSGDFNGDGLDDLATLSPDAGGGWADNVYLEYGTSTGFRSAQSPVALPAHMRRGGSPASYQHLVGDFDGDGRDDIATLSARGGGGWADNVYLEYGTPTGFRSAQSPAALPAHMRRGGSPDSYRHLVGDFDGDGRDDIATLSARGGGGWAENVYLEYGTPTGFRSAQSPIALPAHMRRGGSPDSYQHLVGDFDGDGCDDIATLSARGGGGWAENVYLEYGTPLGFRSAQFTVGLSGHMRRGNAPESYRHLVGDFDGDGRDDIATLSALGGGGWAENVYVEYGTPSGFRSVGHLVGLPGHMRRGNAPDSYQHLVGDFDGDGRDDIATLSVMAGGGWAGNVYIEHGQTVGFRSASPAAVLPGHMRNGLLPNSTAP